MADHDTDIPGSSVDYSGWGATCDTLHGHTQVLGKLAVELAPPEPQLQHAALRLTARGWETLALPAADGSGAITVALDLRAHEAVVEHSGGGRRTVPLPPNRAVGAVTRDVLAAVAELAGAVKINPQPQEVPWTTPLDRDDVHASYDTDAVERYFAAATRAAAALSAFRAPFRGRSTPVNAWWGSFDLSLSLYSGAPATPPSDDFIDRNAMVAQEVAVGWWPGNAEYPRAAFYAYAYPAPDGYSHGSFSPAQSVWSDALGEYLLHWSDVESADDPHEMSLEFLRNSLGFSCDKCQWDHALTASALGVPPPIH